MKLFRLPSVRRIFFRASVYKASPGACFARATGRRNIYIRFGNMLYRQIVGIPMGTNRSPLVADLFLFCYERDFMTSLSNDNQADIIEAFNSTSKYLDDLLNIEILILKE